MSDIEKNRISEIVSLYKKLEISLRASIESAMRIGEILTQQKDGMNHGEFTPWLVKNLPFISKRTARRWMALHKNRDKLKTDSVSDLTSAYKLLEAPKDVSENFSDDKRTIVKMDDIEQNPFFDLSMIPGEAIQHWVNVLGHDMCQPLPYWLLPVRRHKDKYQLIVDHDRWAAMKIAGRKDAAVAIVENMTDDKMKSTLELFDINWYQQYIKYLRSIL